MIDVQLNLNAYNIFDQIVLYNYNGHGFDLCGCVVPSISPLLTYLI